VNLPGSRTEDKRIQTEFVDSDGVHKLWVSARGVNNHRFAESLFELDPLHPEQTIMIPSIVVPENEERVINSAVKDPVTGDGFMGVRDKTTAYIEYFPKAGGQDPKTHLLIPKDGEMDGQDIIVFPELYILQSGQERFLVAPLSLQLMYRRITEGITSKDSWKAAILKKPARETNWVPYVGQSDPAKK
jgi:hypothetical protein